MTRRLDRSIEVAATPQLALSRLGLADLGRRATSFPGLGFSTAWLWALVRSEQRQLMVLREYGVAHASIYYVLEVADDPWTTPRVVAAQIPGHDRLYVGTTRFEPRSAGRSHLLTGNNPLYPALRIELAPERITWEEADLVDLTLHLREPTLDIRVPGPPDDCGYASSVGWVEGTVDGEEVSGFGGLDRSCNEPGITWGQCKVFRHLEEAWFVWANRLEDGRDEHGWVVCGPQGFRLAALCRDDEDTIVDDAPRVERTIEERDGRRVLMAADLHVGGRHHRWSAERNVAIPGMDLFVDWMHGRVDPVDGPAVVEGGAICELFKHVGAPDQPGAQPA